MVDGAVYEGLITYKPGTYDVVKQLAETFEPSADGKSFHFTLKKGVQFQGGYGELTTDDVKFSFERIAGMTKPALQSAYVADWAPQLKEVQIASKYEGTIVLNNVFAPLMHTTLPALSGLIVSKKAVLDRGKQFGAHPIGRAPTRCSRPRPTRQVVLTEVREVERRVKGVRCSRPTTRSRSQPTAIRPSSTLACAAAIWTSR